MYLDSKSPEVSAFLEAIGGDPKKVFGLTFNVRAGEVAILTLDQLVPSKLVPAGVRRLEIDYKMIRRDYAELLEPLIERITGSKTPTRSELEIGLRALNQCLNEPV